MHTSSAPPPPPLQFMAHARAARSEQEAQMAAMAGRLAVLEASLEDAELRARAAEAAAAQVRVACWQAGESPACLPA